MREKPKRGRGRPAAPEGKRRDENLTLRVRAEVKEALERQATKSGRSLSAEAGVWMEQALLSEGVIDQALDLAFGRQVAGLVLLLARVVRDAGAHAAFMATSTMDGAANWLSNPYAVAQVSTAVAAVFEAIQPEGDAAPPQVPGLAPGNPALKEILETLGRRCADGVLGAIAGRVSTRPGSANDGELGRWAAPVRERLGPGIVERIKKNSSDTAPVMVAVGPPLTGRRRQDG